MTCYSSHGGWALEIPQLILRADQNNINNNNKLWLHETTWQFRSEDQEIKDELCQLAQVCLPKDEGGLGLEAWVRWMMLVFFFSNSVGELSLPTTYGLPCFPPDTWNKVLATPFRTPLLLVLVFGSGSKAIFPLFGRKPSEKYAPQNFGPLVTFRYRRFLKPPL